MVRAVTTPLHSIYQGSPHYGPRENPTCEAISPDRKTHFSNNEKILYLQKTCLFGRM